MSIKSIRTAKGVSVFIKGRQPINVDATAANYDDVLAAVASNDLDALEGALNLRTVIEAKSFGKLRFDENGTLFYGSFTLPQTLADYVLPILKGKGDVEPITLFIDNLLQNPISSVVNELMLFLDKSQMPITPDGHFLAYKKVRGDYMDCYTGTLSNKVGEIVSIPAGVCDTNRHNTCSVGLHFCSKTYLNYYPGDRIMVVKVNPSQVVAIPSDYNEAKGRAWSYEVVAELNTIDGDLVRELGSFFLNEFDSRGEEFVTEPVTKANSQGAVSVKKVVTKKANAGLTPVQVKQVRKLLAEGKSVASVARTVGTSERTVGRVRDYEAPYNN